MLRRVLRLVEQSQGHYSNVNIKTPPAEVVVKEFHVSANKPNVHLDSNDQKSWKSQVTWHNVPDQLEVLDFPVVYSVVTVTSERCEQKPNHDVENLQNESKVFLSLRLLSFLLRTLAKRFRLQLRFGYRLACWLLEAIGDDLIVGLPDYCRLFLAS